MKKLKTGLKIVIFIAVAAVLFCGVSYIMKPHFEEWSEPFVEYDFYNEPENTIETLFLGASVSETGINPMQLYEDYGICSYNLGTQSQPLMGSFYLAEETYRLHSETLDTIVLDVSMMHTESADGMYIKIFDVMEMNGTKLHFLKDYADDFDEFLAHLIPVIYYHDSWKSLSESNFRKAWYDNNKYTRGYTMVLDQNLDTTNTFTEISVPLYMLQSENTMELLGESVTYLLRLIEFCEERDIRLVLIKTPQANWSDEAHNSVQLLADEYQLDFLDFNYMPLIDEIEYNGATDSTDAWHLNYYGSINMTDWIGRYLVEECGNKDIRGEEKYDFMEDQLADYHRKVAAAYLNEIIDPAEYLSAVMTEGDYTVFIAAQDDASEALTEEQREIFASLGLTELSELSFRESYLALIGPDGVTEMSKGEGSTVSESGKLSDKTEYSVKSAGYNAGNSSIKIGGKEYAPQSRGLNIVVYDNNLKTVVDNTVFDTYESAERDYPYYKEALEKAISEEGTESLEGQLYQLYLYDQLCEDIKTTE